MTPLTFNDILLHHLEGPHVTPVHQPRLMTALTYNDILLHHSEGPHVTPVHEPKLSGASDKITKEEVERRLEAKQDELRTNTDLSEEDVEAKMKEEKMKIALEKMKLASKRKEVIKVFNNDGSNKTVVVEEGMTAAVVCYLLVTKNHFEESPNWVLIERLGDVGLGMFLLSLCVHSHLNNYLLSIC